MKIKIDKKTDRQVDTIAKENNIDRNVLLTICQEQIKMKKNKKRH